MYGTNFENCPEPIYGNLFLPRKFKIAITVPGDNSVDLLTNDIGIVVMSDKKGNVTGYNLLVGGGMGRALRNSATYARLADPLGYVDKADIFHAVKAIVAVQRDYGRRDDRKQARLKYLVAEWGIDKFRTVTQQYFGKSFQPFQKLPEWEMKDYLGWAEQGDGKLAYGIYVQVCCFLGVYGYRVDVCCSLPAHIFYTRMYTHMYTHMYTSMYAHMYTHMYTHIHTFPTHDTPTNTTHHPPPTTTPHRMVASRVRQRKHYATS